ncbi:phosphatase PAP2 family protein [Neolewinella persica]|uniref:phosphatase PAP2 family protein n=1 Tax=Neolewinella persica TaxID=70998 RepID=UPI0003A99963|nr:phosphatase PAP2 family protein [Neolewinella persica]
MPISSRRINRSLLNILSLIVLLVSTISAMAQVEIKDFEPFKFHLEETLAPVNATELEEEIVKVIELQEGVSAADIREMNYWNASYPSYRWHQIMMEISRAHKGHKNGGRVVILHLAIYDALAEVWKNKQRHQMAAPFRQNANIRKLGRERDYSSFICEWSAAASAAHQVIGYYFPDRRPYLDSLLAQFKDARLRTGLQFPSDIERGAVIGEQIANEYIEYAKTDRTERIWEGQVPSLDSLWTGTPSKWDPMKRQWRPLTLLSPDQFRPAPPPSDWTADMEELRRFNAANKTSEIAWKWKSAPVWDNLLERKILAYDLGPFEAAFATALFHTARFDGIVAAWDGKYHYWGIRPFQYDPTFQPILVKTPNFPGYPAGHTTVAGSLATALSFLFPQDEQFFHKTAKECSESRFEGGVHFRTDNEVGLVVGSRVGEQVIKAFLEKVTQNKRP